MASSSILSAVTFLCAAFAFCFAAEFAKAEDAKPMAYRIEVEFSRAPNESRTVILSRPTLITLDRQEAVIQVGQQEQVAIEGDEAVVIESGVTCTLTPYRLKDGTVKLDIQADIVTSDGMPEVGFDALTRKVGVHCVRHMTPGKQIRFPITPRGQFPAYELSLLISEEPLPRGNADVDGAKAAEDVFRFFTSGGR